MGRGARSRRAARSRGLTGERETASKCRVPVSVLSSVRFYGDSMARHQSSTVSGPLINSGADTMASRFAFQSRTRPSPCTPTAAGSALPSSSLELASCRACAVRRQGPTASVTVRHEACGSLLPEGLLNPQPAGRKPPVRAWRRRSRKNTKGPGNGPCLQRRPCSRPMHEIIQAWLDKQCGQINGATGAVVLVLPRGGTSLVPAAHWPSGATRRAQPRSRLRAGPGAVTAALEWRRAARPDRPMISCRSR
jgi:hypothetical protein